MGCRIRLLSHKEQELVALCLLFSCAIVTGSCSVIQGAAHALHLWISEIWGERSAIAFCPLQSGVTLGSVKHSFLGLCSALHIHPATPWHLTGEHFVPVLHPSPSRLYTFLSQAAF